MAENKKPPIEGRWHEERVTEGWLLAKSKIKYGYIQITGKCEIDFNAGIAERSRVFLVNVS